MPRRAMLNILGSLVGAARSFFKTQKSLALENLALRHQTGVVKRTVGNRRLKLGAADRGLWATLLRVFPGWEQAKLGIELSRATVPKYMIRPRKPPSPCGGEELVSTGFALA